MRTSSTTIPRRWRLIGGLLVTGLAVIAGTVPALSLPMQDDGPGDIPGDGPVITRPPTTVTTVPPPSDFTIRGAVWIGGKPVFSDGSPVAPALPCNASPSQVTVSATRSGVTKTTHPVANPYVYGGWGYSFTNLARGTWTVSARLNPGVCQYGRWFPVSRTAAPPTTGANPVKTGVDFEHFMPTKISRIDGGLAASLLDGALNSAQLHLDNFGPQHGLSHHEADASSLTWGGSTTVFNIPEKQYDLDCGWACPDAGQARLYVQDVNLNDVAVGWTSPQFELDATFEDAGREVKGFQSYDSSWDYLDFVTDDTVPDFQISNAHLKVKLTPVADSAGRLTYSVGSVDFIGDIQATGGCDIFGIDICEFALGYKAELANTVKSKVASVIGTSSAKAAVGEALKPQLAALGIYTVSSVLIEGNDLVIVS